MALTGRAGAARRARRARRRAACCRAGRRLRRRAGRAGRGGAAPTSCWPPGSRAAARWSAPGDTAVRLGEHGHGAADRAQPRPAGSARRAARRLAAVARAPARRGTRCDVPPGERRRFTVTAAPDPARRPAAPTGSRCASSGRSAWPAGRARTTVPWSVRALPPFTSRRHLPARLARLRELDGRSAVMVRGQGTEFDSLREYVAGDDVRSIDWRATARRGRRRGPHLAPGAGPARAAVLDTGRTSAGRVGDAPRLDAAMDAALLLAALAARAGDRVDLLAYDRAVRARVVRRRAPGRCCPRWSTRWPRSSRSWSRPTSAAWSSAVLAGAAQRSLVVLFTALDAGGRRGGPAAVLASLTARHTVLVAAVADPRVAADGGRARRRRSRCTTPPRPSRPSPSAGAVAPAAGRRGVDGRRRAARRPRRPPSPTPTSP